MERMICLDGVPITLGVEKVEIDLACPGLRPADHPDGHAPKVCADGEHWQPIMTFHDGTTIYLHCPPEGEDGPLGYHVDGPQQHRWNITIMEEGAAARLSLEIGDRALL